MNRGRVRPNQDSDLLVAAVRTTKAEEQDLRRLSDVRGKKQLGVVLKHDYRKEA
ncbi:MAG: hypothetical protein GX575_13320 [Candidatus Anammoximicrobium sp.]|nr:hypothetical protein [Candidatus Anammoximicrobium sp.]